MHAHNKSTAEKRSRIDKNRGDQASELLRPRCHQLLSNSPKGIEQGEDGAGSILETADGRNHCGRGARDERRCVTSKYPRRYSRILHNQQNSSRAAGQANTDGRPLKPESDRKGDGAEKGSLPNAKLEKGAESDFAGSGSLAASTGRAAGRGRGCAGITTPVVVSYDAFVCVGAGGSVFERC